ncbi:hypothetical protein CKAH01_18499 [Colletotrichum kahawae]|uniref:Uncharacterized protein n=1 Tax=Colletotrichum kahawae TaxID=34407 RepID=A0AAD9Y6W7_COLKA|nr:hypothetical protein CKAH01_18499 [Colletotrichum kahawae]
MVKCIAVYGNLVYARLLCACRFRSLSMSTISKYPRERLAGPSPILEGSRYHPRLPRLTI